MHRITMKDLLLMGFYFYLLLRNVKCQDPNKQSCNPSNTQTITLTKEDLQSGKYDKQFEDFFTHNLQDIDARSVSIETSFTAIRQATGATRLSSKATKQTTDSTGLTKEAMGRATEAVTQPQTNATEKQSNEATVSAMEASTLSGNETTEASISSSPPVAPLTTKPDDCKTNPSGGCFWTELIQIAGTNITRANKTCVSQGAALAVIRDQKMYDEIVEDTRKKLNASWNQAGLWLGMTYNPQTKVMNPAGTVNTPWFLGFPRSDSRNTGVLIFVNSDIKSPNQGLMNLKPSATFGGVVCWKPSLNT